MLTPTQSTINTINERAVLACLINQTANDPTWSQLANVKPSPFLYNANKIIFEAMLWCREHEVVNSRTIYNRLHSTGKLSAVTDMDGLLSLITDDDAVIAELPYYMSSLLSDWQRYAIASQSAALLTALKQPEIDTAAAVNDFVGYSDEAFKMSDISTSTRDEDFLEFDKLIKNSVIDGIPMPVLATGFKALDAVIDGFEYGTYNVIAARSGMGKTTFLINMILNICKNKELGKILFYSMEISSTEVFLKMVSSISGVGSRLISQGRVPRNRVQAVLDAVEYIKTLNFEVMYVDELTTSAVLQSAKQVQSREKVELVCIDYMTLLAEPEAKTDLEAMNIASRALKVVAKKLKVPVVVLAQCNKESDKKVGSKEPTLTDILGANGIVSNAHTVLGLYDDFKYTQENCLVPDQLKVLVLKGRNTGTGEALLYRNNAISLVRDY